MAPSTAAPVVLGLDTATAETTVAVTRRGELVDERTARQAPGGRPRHAAALLGEIEAVVATAGGWREIGLIAVGIGPGTFTGLRIGIATARALAQGRALPLAGVGSLAALARGIEAGAGAGAADRPLLALIDARRGELFAALRPSSDGELSPPVVAAPSAVVERVGGLSAPPLAAGDGSLRFRAELEAGGVEVLADEHPAHRIRARYVCDLATQAWPAGPGQAEPIYLRRPDAEVWRERRERDPRPDRR